MAVATFVPRDRSTAMSNAVMAMRAMGWKGSDLVRLDSWSLKTPFSSYRLANHEVRKALKRLSALTRGRPHFSEIEVGVKGHRAATSL